MELGTFLAGDAALLVFSGLGLVATGLAIVRDIPAQRRIVEQPVRGQLAQPAYRSQGSWFTTARAIVPRSLNFVPQNASARGSSRMSAPTASTATAPVIAPNVMAVSRNEMPRCVSTPVTASGGARRCCPSAPG